MNEKQSTSRNMLVEEDSVLVVIDVQEILMPVIADKSKVIENIVRLLKFARIVNLPVVLTEQERLGATVSEVRKEIPDCTPIGKITFDAFSNAAFVQQLQQLKRKTLILTGVETHICVAQTALHALPDFTVHVVSDAVSSRTSANWTVGLERTKQCGAFITSTEMVIYELLKRAGTDAFRAALKLVK
jgi:nicotinamidase-related amidase